MVSSFLCMGHINFIGYLVNNILDRNCDKFAKLLTQINANEKTHILDVPWRAEFYTRLVLTTSCFI